MVATSADGPCKTLRQGGGTRGESRPALATTSVAFVVSELGVSQRGCPQVAVWVCAFLSCNTYVHMGLSVTSFRAGDVPARSCLRDTDSDARDCFVSCVFLSNVRRRNSKSRTSTFLRSARTSSTGARRTSVCSSLSRSWQMLLLLMMGQQPRKLQQRQEEEQMKRRDQLHRSAAKLLP